MVAGRKAGRCARKGKPASGWPFLSREPQACKILKQQYMPQFEIGLAVNQKSKKVQLGSIIVTAKTEKEAYMMFWKNIKKWFAQQSKILEIPKKNKYSRNS